MNLTIDPDMFIASKQNWNCNLFIQSLFSYIADYVFVVNEPDNQKVDLIREYKRYYEENICLEKDTALLILEKILDYSQIFKIRTETEEDVDLLIEKNFCSDPIEQTMIRVVSGALRRENIPDTIYLPGPSILDSNRHDRKLYDSNVVSQFGKVITPFFVRHACDFSINPIMEPEEEAQITKLHSRIFEVEVEREMGRAYPYINFADKEMVDLKAALKHKNEVDLLGKESREGSVIVWLGECKLREDHNKENPLDLWVIEKLQSKLALAKEISKVKMEYEVSDWQIFIASNASGLSQEAEAEAREMNCRFFHVELEPRWWNKGNWVIKKLVEK